MDIGVSPSMGWMLVTTATAVLLWTTCHSFDFRESSCSSMEPIEMRQRPQTTASPFIVTTVPPFYEPQKKTTVTVTSSSSTSFRNVMLKTICVFCQKEDEYIGTFSAFPGTPADLIDCNGNVASAIATASNALVTSFDVEWTPLPSFAGEVMFKATVVVSRTIWYQNVTSSSIAQDQPMGPPPEPSPETSTEPPPEPSPEPPPEPSPEPPPEPSPEPPPEPSPEPPPEPLPEPPPEPSPELPPEPSPPETPPNERPDALLAVCSSANCNRLRKGLTLFIILVFSDLLIL